MIPATAVTERGITHNQLGNIYGESGNIERALQHYQQNIRYCEQAGDILRAGRARTNVAITLLSAGRPRTRVLTLRPRPPTSGPSETAPQTTSKKPNA